MIIIGERINSSRKTIKDAIEKRDEAFIRNEAIAQRDAGANFIDINCGTFLNEEASLMEWLIGIVQDAVELPLCIDSPDPNVIKKALTLCKKRPAIVNSVTAETKKADEILPLVKEYDAYVIGLTMDETGMPRTAEDRVKMAEKILVFAKKYGVDKKNIYFDPLVQPVSSDQTQAKALFEAITMIKNLGDTKTTCGLSNISYGLPSRPLINATFLAMCVAAGLDAVMIDTLNEKLMSVLSASLVLTGEDQYCMNYIQRFRAAKVKV